MTDTSGAGSLIRTVEPHHRTRHAQLAERNARPDGLCPLSSLGLPTGLASLN